MVTPTCPARDSTNSPRRESCSPARTPPHRCAHRRAAHCSPAATRRATACSGWPITAGSIATESARSRTCLSESGWHTALFGMQHETSYPSRLGFDEFDVSNSYCEYVVEHATRWLANPPQQPFLLTAGFFETHRPYPRDRYDPPTPTPSRCPTTCPIPMTSARTWPSSTASIAVADAAVGQLLDTLATTGSGPHHLGGVHDRPRTGAAPCQVDALRRRHRDRDDRAAAAATRTSRRASTTTCSAAWTWCPPCSSCSASTSPTRSTGCHMQRNLLKPAVRHNPCATEVYTTKTYHDSFDPIRAIRTKEYSYIENYASRPLLDLPWDIADSAPGRTMAPLVEAQRPERELYDLARRPHGVAQPARS